MHYTPAEFFPIFNTGDVFIKTELVTPSKQWQLHSNILARFSSWFAKSLSSMATSTIGAQCASYIIEEVDGKILLVQQQATGERPVIEDANNGTLKNIKITMKNEDPEYKPSFCNPTDHAATIDLYDQIFSTFYNIPIDLSAANIAASLTHSENLTKTARNLGCLESLASLTFQINATLLQHRHALFRAIKNDPARWLLLSLSLQNDSIYTEALIHMSGAHPCWPWPTPRSNLPEEILRLITTKSASLNHLCTEVERSLLLLTIHVGRNANSHAVSPVTNSEFDTWFIVSTFRSILGKELTELDNNRKKPLLRGTMFRKIRKGEGYMPYEDMRRMMEQVMLSSVQNLSEDLAMLKREASVYVEELARNECLLDVEGQKVGWLTCVNVGKEDIPWRAGDGDEVGR